VSYQRSTTTAGTAYAKYGRKLNWQLIYNVVHYSLCSMLNIQCVVYWNLREDPDVTKIHPLITISDNPVDGCLANFEHARDVVI
jgi:hypothetical protein